MDQQVQRLWQEAKPTVIDRLNGNHIGMLVVTGSHAYGTAREDSDLDMRGFYIASEDDMMRLRPPQEQYEIREPDVVVFELRKFVKLAAAANPNVLETLWAPALLSTIQGDAFRQARNAFLSKKVRKTYGGYARAQLEKVQRGYLKSRSRDFRRDKFILHLLRLFEQGTALLRTGDQTIRLEDPEALMWKARQLTDDALLREFTRLDAIMNEAALESPLPNEPDYATLDMLMIGARRLTPHRALVG